MKFTSLIVFAAAFMPAVWCGAQGGALETTQVLVKEKVEAAYNKLEEIRKLADEQLKKANEATEDISKIEEHTEKMQKSLENLEDAFGHPKDHKFNGKLEINGARQDLEGAIADGLKERPNVNKNDKSIFRETGGGIIEAVGEKYLEADKKDPKEKPRKTQDYVGEAEQIKAVNEYYRIRDAAVERRKKLLEVLQDVLEDMDHPPSDKDNFARLAKQTALVNVLQGQIELCSNDINNAYNDVAVKGLQVYALNSVKDKAKAEPMLASTEQAIEDAKNAINAPLKEIPTETAGAPLTGSSGGSWLPWRWVQTSY